MKKLFIALVMVFSLGVFAQWQPMGVTSGRINCMIADPTQSIIMLATDSGVFYAPATDLAAWVPFSFGLQDSSVLKMIWSPPAAGCCGGCNAPGCSIYAVLTPGGVHATTSKMFASTLPRWVPADPLNLMDASGNMGYQGARAIGFFFSGSMLYVYLAVDSQGIYYRALTIDGTGTPSWDAAGWTHDTAYPGSLEIHAMATMNQAGTLLVGVQGGIYLKTATGWSAASGTSLNHTYTLLSGDPLATGNTAQVIAGYYDSTNTNYSLALSVNAGGSFSGLCGAGTVSLPAPFTDLFMNGPVGVGSTGSALFKINPAACPGPFTHYSNFLGNARAVMARADGSILVGTAGNGLWEFNDPNSGGNPVGNVGQLGVTSGIMNQNVSDIVQTVANSSIPGAPPVLFTASATNGLYKCFKPTYCTRYFFAPDRLDGVAGTSVALVPGYDEFGVVAYSTGGIAESILQAGGGGYAVGDTGAVSGCGNGQATYVVDAVASGAVTAYHLIDLGKGYGTGTCSTTRGGMQPGNGAGFAITVTAVTNSMDIGVKTLFLGTRDFGIHRSDNGGASWKKLINFPHPENDTTREYEIVKVLVAPDFNPNSTTHTDQHVFAITRDGWIFFSRDGGETWATETGAIAAASIGAPGTNYDVGDTGTVSGCGNAMATYMVDAVTSGAVTAFHIVDPGQGYDTTHNPCTTMRAGVKPGLGSGLTLNILEVMGGKTSLAAHFVITNDAAISPGYVNTAEDNCTPPNCPILSNRILFVANSNGLIKVRIKSLTPLTYSMVPVFQANSGTHFLPILSVAMAPCYDSTAPECAGADPRERNFVLAGTDGQGIYYSSIRGDAGTFNPVAYTLGSNPYCSNPAALSSIPELTLHPKAGASPNCAGAGDAKCLLTYYAMHSFGSTASTDHGLYYMRFVPGPPPQWDCQSADPAPTCHPELADYMVPVITFSPTFDGVLNKDLYAGHVNAGMWHAQHPPTSASCTPPLAWDPLKGFNNTPERINSLAECPDTGNPTNPNRIVLAGTTDLGAMISFNSGQSYYPWGFGLEDPAGHTLHDVFAVSCSDRYDPCQPTGTCPQHRVLASAAACTNYAILNGEPVCSTNPTDAHTYQGIYWGNLPPSQYGVTRWTQGQYDDCPSSAPCPGPFTGHDVREIRYCTLAEPLMASDAGSGSLFSQFSGPDLFGAIWHPDRDPEAPSALSDITCPGGQPGPTVGLRALPVPRGGRPSFIWGAQSGFTQGFRAVGAAKFKSSGSNPWQTCTGLSTSANWRSVIMLDTGTVLIGDQGEESNVSSGIYRNDQDGSTCSSWSGANMGFTSGDSSEITQDYSEKVIAFAKVANGVLAAMEQGGLNNRAGGVFFSDTASDGSAWVPVNSGMSCTSNYEVYNGTHIYTGSTCNGVYSTDTITYDGYPTAYFAAVRSSDPWHENRVQFTDRSAGLITSCAWTFGDSTGSTACNPSHDYEIQNYLNASVTLTATNAAAKSDEYSAAVEAVDTRMISVTKVSGNTVRVTWAIPGGGKSYTYALYKDTTPVGSGAALVADCTAACATECSCEFSEGASTAYYKIRTSW